MFKRKYILVIFCLFSVSLVQTLRAQEAEEDSILFAPNPVSIGYDRNVVCLNDTITLSVDYSALGVILNPILKWSTGETTREIKSVPGVNQYYSVDVFDGTVFRGRDSVYVYVTTRPDILTVGDSICLGDEALLYVIGGSYYSWGVAGSEGTTDSINRYPLQTETHYVKVSNYPIDGMGYKNACYAFDSATVVVFEEPNYTLVGHTSYCKDAFVVLSVENAIDPVWEGEHYSNSYGFKLVMDTVIRVSAKDRFGCEGEKKIEIKIMEAPSAYIEVSEDTLCLGAPLTARVVGDLSVERVKWSNGSTEREITWTPLGRAVFFVEVYAPEERGGCFQTIYDTVDPRECVRIYFPTGFRIGGQTKTFGPIGEKEDYKTYYMAIFNATGTMIYQTNQPFEKGWDGKFKGEVVHPGAYIYIFKGTSPKSSYEKRGTVVVVG